MGTRVGHLQACLPASLPAGPEAEAEDALWGKVGKLACRRLALAFGRSLTPSGSHSTQPPGTGWGDCLQTVLEAWRRVGEACATVGRTPAYPAITFGSFRASRTLPLPALSLASSPRRCLPEAS